MTENDVRTRIDNNRRTESIQPRQGKAQRVTQVRNAFMGHAIEAITYPLRVCQISNGTTASR